MTVTDARQPGREPVAALGSGQAGRGQARRVTHSSSAAPGLPSSRLVPGPGSLDQARQFSAEEIAAAFRESIPQPDAETDARIERAILRLLQEFEGEVVEWSRVRRRLRPEWREDFAPFTMNRMWSEGKLWVASVGGKWVVSLGDDLDAARAERDRAEHRTTAPQAV